MSRALDLRGRRGSGQAGGRRVFGLLPPPPPNPRLLGEVKLAEGDGVFDEQGEVLSLEKQGLPAG